MSSHVCNICGEKCGYHENHVIHLSIKHDISKCDVCARVCRDTAELRQHLATHLRVGDYFTCGTCERRVLIKQLHTHMMVEHPGENHRHCEGCAIKSKPASRLDKHGYWLTKCTLCKLLFPRVADLRLHFERNPNCLPAEFRVKPTDTYPKQCQRCEQSFSTPYDLQDHMWGHLQIKPYRCSNCRGMSQLPSLFRTHVKCNCAMEFKCDICTRQFTNKSVFQYIQYHLPIEGSPKTHTHTPLAQSSTLSDNITVENGRQDNVCVPGRSTEFLSLSSNTGLSASENRIDKAYAKPTSGEKDTTFFGNGENHNNSVDVKESDNKPAMQCIPDRTKGFNTPQACHDYMASPYLYRSKSVVNQNVCFPFPHKQTEINPYVNNVQSAIQPRDMIAQYYMPLSNQIQTNVDSYGQNTKRCPFVDTGQKDTSLNVDYKSALKDDTQSIQCIPNRSRDFGVPFRQIQPIDNIERYVQNSSAIPPVGDSRNTKNIDLDAINNATTQDIPRIPKRILYSSVPDVRLDLPHSATKQSTGLYKTSLKKYYCDYCPEVFDSAELYQIHSVNHLVCANANTHKNPNTAVVNTNANDAVTAILNHKRTAEQIRGTNKRRSRDLTESTIEPRKHQHDYLKMVGGKIRYGSELFDNINDLNKHVTTLTRDYINTCSPCPSTHTAIQATFTGLDQSQSIITEAPNIIIDEPGAKSTLPPIHVLACVFAAPPPKSVSRHEAKDGHVTEIQMLCASGPFGGATGLPFTDSSLASFGLVNRVGLRHGKYVDGIKMRYGSVWGPGHGADLGTYSEFAVDGKIIGITGYHGSFVEELTFIDTAGIAHGPYGVGDNTRFSATYCDDCGLRYISGSAGRLVDSITFHFECPSE